MFMPRTTSSATRPARCRCPYHHWWSVWRGIGFRVRSGLGGAERLR